MSLTIEYAVIIHMGYIGDFIASQKRAVSGAFGGRFSEGQCLPAAQFTVQGTGVVYKLYRSHNA